jgi:hypothetical protein
MDDYTINLIQNPSTSISTGDYSLMVKESESMEVGDDVGGSDSEEALKIPLSGVDSRINLTPTKKIIFLAALCFAKSPFLMGA